MGAVSFFCPPRRTGKDIVYSGTKVLVE